MSRPLPIARAWQPLVYAGVILSTFAAVVRIEDLFSPLSGVLWALGLVSICAAAVIHDKSYGLLRWRLGRTDLFLVALPTLAGFALRLHRLDDFLPPLHGDEGEMGLLALLARHGPADGMPPLPLFATAWLSHPTLFHHLQAAALLLFGDTATALRLLSVVFGTLCIPVIYLTGLIGWSRIAAVTAAWLMAVSHLYIQYSRIALNNIETVWLTLVFMLMFAILFEAGRGGKPDATQLDHGAGKLPAAAHLPLLPAAIAGLAVGLGQYFYFGSRLMVVLLPLLVLAIHRGSRISASQLAVLGSAIYISFAPLAAHYSENWSVFVDRMQGVSIFSPDGLKHTLGPEAQWPDDLPSLLALQVDRTLSFFTGSGDRSAFYIADLPAFDFITIMLAWTGLLLAIAHFRRYHERAILTLLGLGFVLGGIVTNDAPNGPRLIVSAAGIFLLGGAALHQAYRLIEKLWAPAARAGLIVVLIPMAAITGYLNYRSYFVQYPYLAGNLAVLRIAHEIKAAPQDHAFYMLTAPGFYAEHGVIRFVTHGIKVEDVDSNRAATLSAEIRAQSRDGRPLMFFFTSDRLGDLPAIEAQFPNGQAETREDASGRFLYTVYRVPP